MKLWLLTVLFISTSSYSATMSFEEALTAILERDTQIPAEEAGVEAADVSLLSSRMSFFPTLETGASREKTYRTQSEVDSIFVTSRLNVFRGGADVANMQAKKYNFNFEKEDLKETRLVREKNGVNKLVNYILKKKEHDILSRLVELKSDSLKTTQARFRKGLTPREEVDKVLVDLNNSKARLKNAEIVFKSAASDLYAILGHVDVLMSWPWQNNLLGMKNADLKSKVMTLDARPDYNKAWLLMEREEQETKGLKRALLPKVDLKYTWSRTQYAETFRTYERSGLISVSFPLFTGFTSWANISNQKATAILARADLTQTQRQIESDWKSIKDNLISRINTAKEREETLALSRRLYQSNYQRFRQGRTSVNDLQVDQNRLLDSENLAAGGWAAAHLAWTDYCQAQGKSVFNCN